MEPVINPTIDKTKKVTPEKANHKIDKEIEESINHFRQQNPEAIQARITTLDKEWDIERTLELNAALLGLTGVILTATVNKKWLILPAIVTTFLVQHAIQGWCPPIFLFRELGIRIRKEIDNEKYALINVLESNLYPKK